MENTAIEKTKKSIKTAFVVLTHRYLPVLEGEHKGKTQVHETCEFVERIKNAQLAEATIIMDSINRKFVKNRANEKGATYDDLESYLMRAYKDKYVTFLNLLGAPIPELTVNREAPAEETAE